MAHPASINNRRARSVTGNRRRLARPFAAVIATLGITASLVIGATGAMAQGAGSPTQAIDSFYTALAAGDCSTAIRFRPGYSEARCNSVSAVTNWNSVLLHEENGNAAVFMSVTYRMNGDTTDRNFTGFASTTQGAGGWTIDRGSLTSEGNIASADAFLKRVFPDDTAASPATPSGEPAQTAAPVIVTKPANSGSANASLFPGSNAETQADNQADTQATGSYGNTSDLAQTNVTDPSMDAPVDAFHQYYDALGSEDCALARRLRPGLSLARCKSVVSVQRVQADLREKLDTHAILAVQVNLTRDTGEPAPAKTRFDGFVTMVPKNGGWVIDGSSYRSRGGTMNFTLYAALQAESYAAGTASTAVVPVRQNLRQTGFGDRTEDFWKHGGPPSFGSQKLLQSCWSAAALRARAGEEKTTKKGPKAKMGPPARLRPKNELAALPAKLRRSIRRVDVGDRKVIALTFDTGEQNNDFAGYDGQIYDYLRANNVKATFYFGGKWMATHPERTMQIIADPLFEPGNHAWTHGNMRVLTGQDADDQVLFTQAQYELIVEEMLAMPCAQNIAPTELAKVPVAIPTFRYPYGTCSNETLTGVNRMGLPAVQWDIVTSDPVRKQSGQAIANIVVRKAKPGSIVIMHSNGRGWNTPDALPIMIPKLRAMGYEFVTVSELLAMGRPIATDECYELKPGDNTHYDRIFGRGTGD